MLDKRKADIYYVNMVKCRDFLRHWNSQKKGELYYHILLQTMSNNTLTLRKAPKPLSYQLFTLWKQICNCLMYSMAYSVCPHHWRFTWLWKCLSPATVMIITTISNKLTIFAEIQRVGGRKGVWNSFMYEKLSCLYLYWRKNSSK